MQIKHFCLFLLLSAGIAFAQAPSKSDSADKPGVLQVEFKNGNLTLQGFLWVPEGKGPFPAVLWNHGSEKNPIKGESLAKFYNSKGYVLFVPHRHGHGQSPGDYIVDLQNKVREQTKDEKVIQQRAIELHELYLKDVIAAVEWLKKQSCVDPKRIAMTGVSYGGIQTILAAEQGLGVRAFVPFAPAAMSWKGNPPLRQRLLRAVKDTKAPMFLIQAENDYNLGPSEVLGKELQTMGKPHRAKLYPPYGKTAQDGHGAFSVRANDIWGPDVSEFLAQSLQK